jgi:two-component system, OmpR family, sensor kinase
MRVPIKAKLTLWYVALFALVLAVLSAFVVVRLRADLYSALDTSLASRAEQIALGYADGAGDGEFADISDSSLAGLPRGESAAQLLSAGGAVLESSGDTIAVTAMVARSVLAKARSAGQDYVITTIGGDSERFRILAVPLEAGAPAGRFIVVASATEDVDASVTRLLWILLLSGPAALAVAALGGWLLAGAALAPVARMTRTASEIGVERLGARVDVPAARDELRTLAITLNDMLARLEAGVAERRQLVADASHELRTPLAIMRAELDVTLAAGRLPPEAVDVLESEREEVERMSLIVADLLALARFDEGSQCLEMADLELAEVVEEAVGGRRSLAEARDVTLTQRVAAVRVHGDAACLAQVVTNLVDNAIEHGGEGGAVTVTLARRGRFAEITVADTGAGIPAADLPHVFERFYRADASRARTTGGSGLGLSIVKETVEAHGGTATARSTPGAGATFVVRIPAL